VLVGAIVALVLAVLVSRLIPSHQLTSPNNPTTILPAQQASCGRAVNDAASNDPRPEECLWQAYSAGKAAQAIVVQYTTEGDPITYTVNVASANQIGVNIQSLDRFGSSGSFAYSCHGLSRQPAVNVLGGFYLTATDCTGPSSDFLDGSRLIIP
jgi:hypothetical protein